LTAGAPRATVRPTSIGPPHGCRAMARTPPPPPVPAPAPPRPAAWVPLLAAALPALAAAVALAPVVHNGFVDVDDPMNFAMNHDYRGLGWSQVRYAFTQERLGVYQPLGSLLLSLQYVIGGLDSRTYHVGSLLLHVLNAAVLPGTIVALLARCRPSTIAADPGRAWLAAAVAASLFAAHPMRAEPVAWATAQLYLPAALFVMLAIRAYLKAHPAGRPTRPGWLAGSYALAIAAMLFMPGAVGLPFLFLVLDAYPLGRFDSRPGRIDRLGRALAIKLPVLVPSLALMAVAYWSKRHNQTLRGLSANDSPWARVAQSGYGVWHYLVKTAAPTGISAFYPRPEQGDFAGPIYVALVAMAILASVAALVIARRRPAIAAAWFAYLVLIGPHAGLIRVGNTLAADRYGYAASLLVAAVVAAALVAVAERLRRPRPYLATVAASGLVAVALLAGLARDHARRWGDSIALWGDALDRAPWSSQLHGNLGTALGEAGRFDEAIAEFRVALAIAPDFVEAHLNLGSAQAALGHYVEAMEHYDEVLRLRPRHVTAYLNRGAALAHVGRLDEAAADYRKALDLQPEHVEVHTNLGGVLVQQRKIDEAIAHYRRAAALRPWHAEAHAGLGASLALKGRLDEAIARDREALKLDPDHDGARLNLGIALAQSGRLDEAIAELRALLDRDPAHADARNALGAALVGQGHLDAAIAEFAEVLRLRPGHEQARVFLDQALALQGEVRKLLR